MAIAAVSPASSATEAFGLNFQSLLRIILTELTYQDPLKPLDNFQFVSQLGQFAQLQQSQSLNDQLTQLLASQAAAQATGLIGRTIDLTSSDGVTTSGQVTAVSFTTGQPQITIRTADGDIIGGLSLANISQVR